MTRISFARHQFPPAIIRHTVWLYLRFTLSYRDVEDLLAERGLDVSYESVRRWVLKFGPLFARELRRRRHRPTSRWHFDEMAVLIGGEQFWPWRAIDDEGEVLDLLVQRRRDKNAAVKLMRNLLRKQGFAPDVLVTDKLRSYGAAKAALGLSARHEQGCARTIGPRIRISLCDGASARCSASNRQDQPSASSLLTPPSTTLLMSSAISHPAPRSAPSEAKRSRHGGLRPPPEPELKLPGFTPLLRVPVTAPPRLRLARRGGAPGADDRPGRPSAVRPARQPGRRARAHRPAHVPAVRPMSATQRRARREGEDLLDVQLADLPAAARWREWMLRVEAAIFASARPVPREALVRLVGQDCRFDDLIADLTHELRGRPYDLALVAGGYARSEER